MTLDKKESPKGLSSYMDYKEHHINSLKNHISGWYIDKEVCAQILTISQERKILFGKIDTGFRNYQSCSLETFNSELQEKYHLICKDLISLYIDQYPTLKNCFPLQVEPDEVTKKPLFRIQKYKPGSHYNVLHCENDGLPKHVTRVLGFMTYLNDIDEAGTHFPLQDFTSKSEIGLTLLWPAYFTHPHIGLPAIDTEKTIITGWIKWVNLKPVVNDPLLIFRNK